MASNLFLQPGQPLFANPGDFARTTSMNSWTSPNNLLTLGGLGISALGAGLSARSAGKDRESNEALTREQLAEQQRQFNLTNSQQMQARNDNRAVLAALMPQARNFRVTAPDVPTNDLNAVMGTPMSAYMPGLSGGTNDLIPAGGLPQEVIDRFNTPLPSALSPGGTGMEGGGQSSAVADITSALGQGRGKAIGGTLAGAASGASLGFQFGGPIGAGIGGVAGGIAGLINGRDNNALDQRESVAKSLGFPSVDALYQALNRYSETTGSEEGWQLVDIALNKIGRNDMQANQMWAARVAQLLGGS